MAVRADNNMISSMCTERWPVTQIKVLGGSPYEWLGELLAAFNHGDLHAYDALCERHAAALNAQPALVAHERALREKITILCLMELIFKCAAPGLWLDPHNGGPRGLQPFVHFAVSVLYGAQAVGWLGAGLPQYERCPSGCMLTGVAFSQPASGAAHHPPERDCGAHQAGRRWRRVPAHEDAEPEADRGRN